MKILPASYCDELDVEVESPEAIMDLEKGNFSRLYPVLREYRKLKTKNEDTKGKWSLVKKIGSVIGKKRKDKPAAGKNPDFKRINLVFPDEALEDLETHSRLDGINEKFREYCTIERKKEEKSAEALNLVKDCLIFGGTIAVTYGLGFLAYFGYISVLKETPLLISAAADVVLAAGFGVRHKEMTHRNKVGQIEMVDDAELNFVTGNEYKALLENRKNAPKPSHDTRKEAKMPGVARTIEIDCCAFFENERFSTDSLIETYRELYPEKRESMRKRLSDYVNEKILRKGGRAQKHPEAGKDEARLRLVVYAKGGCENAHELQEKFRTYCRSERMKAGKTADMVERVKDLVTFAGPVATTYGLSLAVYGGLIELAKHMPLIIDTAADGVLISGLIPKKVEIGYRKQAELLEKLENAEIKVVSRLSNDGACPRKGFYSRLPVRA